MKPGSPSTVPWERPVNTQLVKTVRVCMCVCIYTCTQGWRAGEDKCSRQMGSKRVRRVQMNEDRLFFKVWPKNLGGGREVKTTFGADICRDGAKARAGRTAGALARTKWRPTVSGATPFPTATHSQFTRKVNLT